MEGDGTRGFAFSLPDVVRFRDVEMAGEGRVSMGRAYTSFLPQGYSTPTWIYLEDWDGQEFTIVVHPLLGSAEIYDERIDPD